MSGGRPILTDFGACQCRKGCNSSPRRAAHYRCRRCDVPVCGACNTASCHDCLPGWRRLTADVLALLLDLIDRVAHQAKRPAAWLEERARGGAFTP